MACILITMVYIEVNHLYLQLNARSLCSLPSTGMITVLLCSFAILYLYLFANENNWRNWDLYVRVKCQLRVNCRCVRHGTSARAVNLGSSAAEYKIALADVYLLTSLKLLIARVSHPVGLYFASKLEERLQWNPPPSRHYIAVARVH